MKSIVVSGICFILAWFFAVCSNSVTTFGFLLKVAFTYGTCLFAVSLLGSIKQKIIASGFWATALALYNLSWFTSDSYVGTNIYYVWLFIALLIGIQFVLFVIIFFKSTEFFGKRLLFLVPFLWVFLENIRYKYIFCGCSWDLAGIALSYNKYSILLSGVLGVKGLSLITVAIAVAWFNCLKHNSWKNFFIWSLLFLFPFLFGGAVYNYRYRQLNESKEFLSLALIQPTFAPYSMGFVMEKMERKWAKLITLFSAINQKVNLIVLPEITLPCNSSVHFFLSDKMNDIFYDILNIRLFSPHEKLSHLDILKVLAHYYNADILIGLERHVCYKTKGKHSYNSAFLITRDGEISFYDKRLLVPIGEYFPGGTLGSKIGKKYFGASMVSPGKDSRPLSGKCTPKFGVSICYEETFSHIVQHYKKQKVRFLVNLTNDGWYPLSKLPYDHFIHGRIRGLELGLPCVRVCNTGITGGWDSLGNTIDFLPYESKKNSASEGVVIINLPLYSYATLYSFLGETWLFFSGCVTILSIIFIFFPKLRFGIFRT